MVMNAGLFRHHTTAFHTTERHLGFRAHSSLKPLHKTAPCHPQKTQYKPRHQVCCVLSQPSLLKFDVAKLTFDDTERVFHLGTDARLGLLQLVLDGAPISVPLSIVHRLPGRVVTCS
jgi:hypothetical protein